MNNCRFEFKVWMRCRGCKKGLKQQNYGSGQPSNVLLLRDSWRGFMQRKLPEYFARHRASIEKYGDWDYGGIR